MAFVYKPFVRLMVVAVVALTSFAAAARPALLVEVESGRVLHAEQPFDLWEPASITKLMTAYVTFKEIDRGNLTLKSPVRMSYRAASQPPSHMAYPVGTIVTIDNALKALLVKSANDVAVAIAESVGGSVEEFADMMNAEARKLGMTDSHFVNPNGLHDDDHYSTARDIALLALAIRRQYPQYTHYFSAEAISKGETVYGNYNFLIGRFAGADGMKTGYVCESGFNLVGSATRGDTTLIAVVLGAMSGKERAEQAADLLAQGFGELADSGERPLLSELEPPPDRSDTVADIRDTVCSQEASEARWANRSLDNFDTTALTPMQREPVAIAVTTGGAVGASKSAVPFLGSYVAEIPLPVERPVSLTDEVISARDTYGDMIIGGLPVPTPRPDAGT